MSEKFTPGPWQLEELASGAFIVDTPAFPVCSRAQSLPEKRDEAYANAHLIAAAPELYTVLADIIDTVATTGDGVQIAQADNAEFDRARAALAKARGEQ